MAFTLYNSLAKGERVFEIPADKKVTMYTCGPTVYGRPHIGNYSSFLMADLLRRWLEVGHGCTVTHVKNITDVGHLVADAESGEDKIEKEARRIAVEKRGVGAQVEHDDVIAVAEMYTSQYLEDEALLRMLEPAARPKASEYVEQMKAMISDLLEKGHAYATHDGIYFDVTSDLLTPYGSLSGNKLDDLQAGSRVDVNEGKRHPADFALWKFRVGANEKHVLHWPSPKAPALSDPASAGKSNGFPDGFPGWHIECSAMSRALLGDTIDIHTGGEDNIFPHHECEIAQSESCTGKPFVRFWLHKRRIDLGDQKMSKSLGNVVTIPDILAKGWSPMDLRYCFLSVHYRTQMKFTDDAMHAAQKERGRIMEWFALIRETIVKRGKNFDDCAATHASCEATENFVAAMDNDLNVSEARAVIFGGMTNYYKFAETGGEPTDEQLDQLAYFVRMAEYTFGCFDPDALEMPQDVSKLLEDRKAARAEKNFAEADRLRDAIAALGYEVKDTSEGQKVRKS